MEITPRHWLIALLVAGLTHAALALALVQMTASPAIVPAGITIELGVSSASSSAGPDGSRSTGSGVLQPVASATPGVRAATASEDERQPTIDAEVRREQNATLMPVAAVETLAAKPLPEQEPKLELQPMSEPAPASKPSRFKPEPEPPKPRTTQSQPMVPNSKTNPERPTKSVIRKYSGMDEGEEGLSYAGAAENGNSVNRSSGSSGRGSVGSDSIGNGSDGNGGQTSINNYYGRLATWLARHKRYPTQARRLRQEGTVKVTFTITRSGRVVSQRIVQSSGYELLDKEVQAMLERASPLPRIPSSLDRSSLTITLPVAFTLR
ncbi:MAG: TonB family protein [Lamprobacter sp.]|uniref:TonB family protein n=1 Tax=Lamprobacter sp. TaxID=3100796 RepID=UPI002B26448C|nr:TonB family protein [Lamprobacter sp.]MEA3639391.1 TonB family protein [Lamprobacter sp.]